MEDLLKNITPEAKKFLEDLAEALSGGQPAEEVGGGKETHIAFALDSSGSMESCRDATIEGYNRSVQDTKRNAHLGGDVYVTLVTFGEGATEVRVKYSHQPIDKLEELNRDTYVPQAGTPMYDGILTAIEELQGYDTPGGDKAFLVNIFTDGEENSSKLDGPELSEIIQRLQGKGNWTFTVTGANINLESLAKTIGVHRANMQSYTPTPAGTANAYAAHSHSTENYMQSRGAGASASAGFYNPQAPQQPSVTIAPVPNTTDASSAPKGFDQRGQTVGTQTNVPPFPTPTGAKNKAWDHDKDEDDDNSLV